MTPRTLQGILLGAVIGVAVGIGAYTFAYAKGWSYITDDPAACANCHVMQDQFDGWLKSSHRSAATCNSCHTPANLLGKYATKHRTASGIHFFSPSAATRTIFKSSRTAARLPSKPAEHVVEK